MSDGVPLALLIAIVVVLLLLSAFFSSTETALLSLNRYRLRHEARAGNRAARAAEQLLQRPDRLIGLVLLGSTLANIGAAVLVTVIALRVGDGAGAVLAGTLIVALLVLFCGEVAPKTIAAVHAERIALPAALIYHPLLKLASPGVWVINRFADMLVRLLGGAGPDATSTLSAEELRSVVAEAGAMVPRPHKRMLLSIIDLDAVTVADVMVPRQEIVGLDLDRPWPENLAVIERSEHARLPVYREDVDNIVGVARVRELLPELVAGTLTQARLLERIREPYFVPESTPLTKQLLNFQQQQRRSAFVVDEYGDIQGLITTQDIVREIVGELDNEALASDLGITKESDRSYVVNASANVRQLNRVMNWDLPTDGPKTLNGLIVEQLAAIPESGTGLTVANYPIEILDASEHGIKKVRVHTPSAEQPARSHAA